MSEGGGLFECSASGVNRGVRSGVWHRQSEKSGVFNGTFRICIRKATNLCAAKVVRRNRRGRAGGHDCSQAGRWVDAPRKC